MAGRARRLRPSLRQADGEARPQDGPCYTHLSVGWVERSENPSTHLWGPAPDGFRGVYHRAGQRPDPVAQPILRVKTYELRPLGRPMTTHGFGTTDVMLSAIIITRNEAHNIAACLDS